MSIGIFIMLDTLNSLITSKRTFLYYTGLWELFVFQSAKYVLKSSIIVVHHVLNATSLSTIR